MPLYEYQCSACANRFEVRQRVADDPIAVCPSCGGAVRRVFHPVGIIFKGSGFYVTDNRKAEASASTAAEKSSTEKASTEKSASDKPAGGDGAKGRPATSATSADGASKTSSGSKAAASAKT
jgi:putative FmdB family regulatory protein